MPCSQQQSNGIKEIGVCRLYINPLGPHRWSQNKQQHERVAQHQVGPKALQLRLKQEQRRQIQTKVTKRGVRPQHSRRPELQNCYQQPPLREP